MDKYGKLSQKLLYQQPKYLCGPSCIFAARDYLRNTFVNEPGAFQATVMNAAQRLESRKKFNPVTLTELLAIGKTIGVNVKYGHLREEALRISSPSLVIVKITWRNYEPIIRLARKFGDHDSEEEHYVLVTEERDSRYLLWEPAFSGDRNSPWLELTWEELQRGNLAIRFEEERGKCIFLS